MAKVLVGMSGGVDSSVAAFLLKEQGYDVEGVTMLLFSEAGDAAPGGAVSSVDPASIQSVQDAKKVCETLGIRHHVLDLRPWFNEEVICPFAKSYFSAETPNPCVLCNRRMKWGRMLAFADELDADYLATGHYAGVEKLPNGRYTVKKAVYDTKDQTYVLCQLTQEQLSRTLMPLYEYDKTTVREIAARIGLEVAQKKDSQDICFIPDGDHLKFLQTHFPEEMKDTGLKPGHFVDRTGRILGDHEGIARYTIGQRKGLKLAMGHPVFVTDIRPETNEVVIGENEDLFSTTLKAKQVNLMGLTEEEALPGKELRAYARIRYAHKGAPCLIRFTAEGGIELVFDEPQRAVTPGQFVVVYEGDHILLGGKIARN